MPAKCCVTCSVLLELSLIASCEVSKENSDRTSELLEQNEVLDDVTCFFRDRHYVK